MGRDIVNPSCLAAFRRGFLGLWVAGAWGVPAATAGPQSPPEPAATPRATPQEAKRPDRLQLNIDKHVERLLAGQPTLPRFDTAVEVRGKAPQVMLERLLADTDLECGPSVGGAPSAAEMRAYRPHPAPYLDFAALGAALAKKFGSKGPARYFLYRVQQPAGVSYSLREDPIPAFWSLNAPGTSFELVESFETREDAVVAWRRVHRGEKKLLYPGGERLPPWVTATCRPKW
jgi:hypothetical protein